MSQARTGFAVASQPAAARMAMAEKKFFILMGWLAD
jgi:hypothetical protein